MAGTTMTPPTGGGFPGQTALSGQQLSAASVNSYRVAAVAERLASHFSSGDVNDPKEFFNLCLSLARGIDYAVANNQVPEAIRNIPSLLKKLCQHGNDLFLQAAVMVLMISVKSACKVGWFSGKDAEELLTLANEIGSSFCYPGDMSAEADEIDATISTIMKRFYPQMKMGQILASLEVKPGYGAYVADFSISKKTSHSAEENIRLFVAQRDNIENSACVITPQQVNFLLNGKAVDRRTNVSMDPGPQLPTNVTSMLKYGTNLLQAVGQFNGHYIVVVAFMSVTPSQDIPVLQEYVQPAVLSSDSDSEIIEGPSRISLNCPISYKRIKTPVKGLLCKHLQCFDFSNYIDINSRRPSWRCPHCNQFLSYPDIRVDQNMVKVLKEVGGSVDGVIISADGSWKALMETADDNADRAHIVTNEQQEPGSMLDSHPLVLDLSKDDEEMTAADTHETEDVKPLQTDTLSALNNSKGAQVEDDFWAGLYFSTITGQNAQVPGTLSQPGSANTLPPNMLTDSFSAARPLNQEPNMSTLVTSSQNSAANNLQLQAPQVDSLVRNEYGRSELIPRHITRTPVAIQALPVQSPSPNLQQRSRPGVNTPIPNSLNPVSQAALSRASSANERQQQVPMSRVNATQVAPGQSGQQAPGAYRTSSPVLTQFQNSHLQQAFNRRMTHQPTSHSPTPVRTSSPVPQAQHVTTPMTRQSQPLPAQVNKTRTVPLSSLYPDRPRAPAGEQSGNTRGVAESVAGTGGPVNVPPEQNWRPTGRMRGSLQGEAYSAALSQFMMLQQSSQPAQATRPNLTSPLPAIPEFSSVRVADSRSGPVSDPARDGAGGSDTQPEPSNGMH